MTGIVLKYRWLIIIVSIVIAIGGALMLPGMETDPDIRNYIPESMESRINTDRIEEEFGVQDMIMIVFKDSCIITADNLVRIRETEKQLRRLSSVGSTISVFNTRRIYGEDGVMYVDPAIKRIPGETSSIDKLKEELRNNPLVMGTVISSDFTMSVIAANIVQDIPEDIILASVDSIVMENPGKAEVYMGGLPYVRKAILKDVRRDGLILVPLALIIMLVFLWLSFREWKGMVLPFTIVILSIAIAMGLAPLLGWKMSIISLIVPIMLIAVANDYGIHMIAKYQELNIRSYNGSMRSIIKEVIRELRKPVLFTGLTTIAGILGLLTHSVIPARHVGILASTGIAVAVLLTLFMLPAWLSMLRRSQPLLLKKENGKTFLDKALSHTSIFVSLYPRRILIIASILTLISASGILLIRVDGNMENLFPSKHPVKISSTLINKHFGGSQSISVMLDGDIMQPSNLSLLENWESDVEKLQGVGNVYSIASVIKEMSKALYEEGEDGYNAIPETRAGVAQMIEIYNMSGDPDDFEKLVDFDYTKAHMYISLSAPETVVIKSVLNSLDELSGRSQSTILIGGYAFIMSEFADRILAGQINSLVFALIVVFFLLSAIFKSARGGLISTLPIFASVVFLLGFMGFSGISLNPATALISSIMIGVGVDYTIHLLWRYKKELVDLNHQEAIIKALTTTGRGIVFNALSVMVGFSVLVFSGFTSIRFFGYLILISIGICLLSALVVIPAIMLVFKPQFIEKQSKIKYMKKIKQSHGLKKALTLAIIMFIPLISNAQDSNAKDIMKKSRDLMKVEAFEAVSVLKISDSKGRVRERSNITASKSFDDGTEKRIIRFLSPADIAGTSMLIHDFDEGQDDMWIYLPALKKTRRIISSEKGKSFMGSVFTNADMASPPLDDFKHSLISDTSDDTYWKIDSKPISTKKEDEYGYLRKVSYISKISYLVEKMEFYDFDNELYKIIDILDIEELDANRYIIKHMTAENIHKGRSSEIILSDIKSGTDLNDQMFNVNSLGR